MTTEIIAMEDVVNALSGAQAAEGGAAQEGSGSGEAGERGNSNAVGSSSRVLEPDAERRPEAGPLPSKRGEIGFQERYQQQLAEEEEENSGGESTLPERHPADRLEPSSETAPAPGGTSTPSADPAAAENAATQIACSTKRTPRKLEFLGGVTLSTFIYLLIQIAFICGTIAGWVLFGLFASSSNNNGSNNANNGNVFGSSTTQIFGHVLFTIALLMQLVFMERRVYRIRAERYCHANPGLPLHAYERERGMGFAPWNRPPLPSYAAALAQSGVGTGDVEDNIIAVPPPPAYGNTRGSTLLLSGFISDTLRAQRRERERMRRSAGSGRGSIRASYASSRPVSYASRDEAWEERSDAMRAVRLEETLARLEDARVTTQDGELRR